MKMIYDKDRYRHSVCAGKLGLFVCVLFVLITSGCLHARRIETDGQPHAVDLPRDTPLKYVFLFIGDGMGPNPIRVAEQLLDVGEQLAMTSFPVHGMQDTSTVGGGLTDSAAAATALACGVKTKKGRVAMDAADKTHYKSIAHILKEKGWRIGIISDVWINHATPAGFYASVARRSQYKSIAAQLPQSGFEFFGQGMGDLYRAGEGDVSVVNSNGYEVIDAIDQIRSLLASPRERVVCANNMPYAIDHSGQPEDGLTLAEYVRVGLACLGTDAPFFMAVEAGKMDWCGHGQDAGSMAHEVLALDQAVQVAIDFASGHPDETLIIVTADHDTGGIGFIRDDRTLLDGGALLRAQRVSYQVLKKEVWQDYQSRNQAGFDKESFTIATEPDQEFAGILNDKFGLDYKRLRADERGVIEAAFARRMGGAVPPEHDVASEKYDNPKFVRKAILQVLAKESGITWETAAHTEADVPVYATGPGAERFAGRYPNTAIPRKILDLVGLADVALPVVIRSASSTPEASDENRNDGGY